MQEKDKKTNSYLEDSTRLADLINGCIYQGKQVLKKENIRERKQVYSVNNKRKGNDSWSIIRDIVHEADLEAVIVLVAVENQSKTHYVMPLRVMRGDVANYYEQWKRIAKEHEEKGDLRDAEFLSGFSKDDRLIPVITLCIYWGEEPWDGPRCLKDILNMQGISEEVSRFLADYPLNLIEVNNFPHTEYFQTDLRVVFEFLRNRGNGQKMKNYMKEHEDDLKNLTEDTFDLLCEISNIKELRNMREKNKNVEGGVNMCRAFEELAEEFRGEGRKEGRKEGWQMAKKVIYMKFAGKSDEEISKSCEITLEDVHRILELPVA